MPVWILLMASEWLSVSATVLDVVCAAFDSVDVELPYVSASQSGLVDDGLRSVSALVSRSALPSPPMQSQSDATPCHRSTYFVPASYALVLV
jgi:hypothetical protein